MLLISLRYTKIRKESGQTYHIRVEALVFREGADQHAWQLLSLRGHQTPKSMQLLDHLGVQADKCVHLPYGLAILACWKPQRNNTHSSKNLFPC